MKHLPPLLMTVILGISLASGVSGRPAEGDTGTNADPLDTDLKIGLALGAGGANGLAHIAILEAFEELGITPHRMAGSSIGAVMGALYASGKSAKDIKKLVEDVVVQESDTWRELLFDGQLFSWFRFAEPELGEGGLINTDEFIAYLRDAIEGSRFEDLQIPLLVVTADLWSREQIVFDAGDLLPVVQASIAVPGLFKPVQINGRVLVDGGIVNPVPYDLLFEDCDVVVAVNVIGKSIPEEDLSLFKSMFAAIRVMQTSILKEKMKQRAPDIYIETRIEGVRLLEFNKIDEVHEQAQRAKEDLKAELRAIIKEKGR